MPVEFRFARRDEYPRISQFLNDYWAEDHVYCRDRALFDWTFRRPGHWPKDEYSFALAEDAGELVGILGGIPFAFNRFGARSSGIWMANYVIRPDHRRGPTALQLLAMFRPPRFDACVAFGINPATSAIYRVLRGEVLPLDPAALRRAAGMRRARCATCLPSRIRSGRPSARARSPPRSRSKDFPTPVIVAPRSPRPGTARTGRPSPPARWARRATATTWSGATCATRASSTA